MGHRALKPQKPLVSDGHQKSVIFERRGLSQALDFGDFRNQRFLRALIIFDDEVFRIENKIGYYRRLKSAVFNSDIKKWYLLLLFNERHLPSGKPQVLRTNLPQGKASRVSTIRRTLLRHTPAFAEILL